MLAQSKKFHVKCQIFLRQKLWHNPKKMTSNAKFVYSQNAWFGAKEIDWRQILWAFLALFGFQIWGQIFEHDAKFLFPNLEQNNAKG